ncbi:TIGR02186 family protein [Phenylobacterium sp.]|uniref:TIGR02186 family protein n=1 Tax=Phenylobacterium sp. TaxID=1871053 RepID=UPI002730E474|nr:TIGR02186 family protein [Phenylobacterium sp.]MDP1599078.1 TIGR02186 family protein [Phenylobacterium sp.]MDP3591723.1 TIGR02186 family protein [Phenylobacterium sp.]
MPYAAPPETPPAAVSAALTTTNVRVTSSFRGARIVLYGAVFDPTAQPSDVVVIVRGPEAPLRMARKTRVAGVWVNSRPVVFEGAPGFYMAASTRPLGEIASFGTLRRLGAGVDHLAINAPLEERTETRYGVRDVVVSRLGQDYLDWRRAVVRLKEQSGLYAADEQGVTFVDRGLFKAEIDLPTAAPIGVYTAEIFLFQNGQPVSRRMRGLTVEKAGIERALYLFAHNRPWSYGLVSVAIALAAGWAASVVFRRN